MKLTRLALDYAQLMRQVQWMIHFRRQCRLICMFCLTQKTTQNQLETDWANWISSKDISDLNGSVTEDNWITGNKLFLTK